LLITGLTYGALITRVAGGSPLFAGVSGVFNPAFGDI
jgi:hypothetical protein